MTATTHTTESSGFGQTLFLALELSKATWRVTCTTGRGHAPRERRLRAGADAEFRAEVARAKQRFGLAPDAPVQSCYEAGPHGFWVARWLTSLGIANVVIDSSSIEVPRRARRAKTDRLDGRRLLALLLRYAGGERSVWKVVRVPSEEAEDQRHLDRTLRTVKSDRTRAINRIRSLLATQGVAMGGALARLDLSRVRRWDGHQLRPGLHGRLVRECEQLSALTQQLRTLERQQRAAIGQPGNVASAQARHLRQLCGIGSTSACCMRRRSLVGVRSGMAGSSAR